MNKDVIEHYSSFNEIQRHRPKFVNTAKSTGKCKHPYGDYVLTRILYNLKTVAVLLASARHWVHKTHLRGVTGRNLGNQVME
jgi:hypothetical protein